MRSTLSGGPCLFLALLAFGCLRAPAEEAQAQAPARPANRQRGWAIPEDEDQPSRVGAGATKEELVGESAHAIESTQLESLSEGGGWTDRKAGQLPVAGHQPAVLYRPSGGQGAMRLLVVAHGAGGRGSDHCRYWDRLVAPDVLLLCLAGKPLRRSEPRGGAYFPDHFALRSELKAALLALESHEPSLAVHERRWFLGYSQGATMGALAIVGEIPFAHLILVEGGGENWSAHRANSFAELGGESVFLSCGTSSCARHAQRSLSVFDNSGIDAETFVDSQAGHTFVGEVGKAALGPLSRPTGMRENQR